MKNILNTAAILLFMTIIFTLGLLTQRNIMPLFAKPEIVKVGDVETVTFTPTKYSIQTTSSGNIETQLGFDDFEQGVYSKARIHGVYIEGKYKIEKIVITMREIK